MKQLSEATVMQEPSTKLAALKAAKCERIYREQASGGRWDRPELQRLLDQLRSRAHCHAFPSW